MNQPDSICPGCKLTMPRRDGATYDGYYNASPECWAVYTEVLANEFSNAFLFGRVHQLSVDSYAVQHAGGKHPDKSVVVHLSGLYLVFETSLLPTKVPALLQQIAEQVKNWPHFEPPNQTMDLTVCDVALASGVEEHIELVRKWSGMVWGAWSEYHPQIAEFVSLNLKQT